MLALRHVARRALATTAASGGSATPPGITAELSSLKSSLLSLLGSSHPQLDSVAKYYFSADGKHLRPMLVLLMSQATNGIGGQWSAQHQRDQDDIAAGRGVDQSLTSVQGVLNDWNPDQMGLEGENDMVFAEPFDAFAKAEPVRPSSSLNNTSTSSTTLPPSQQGAPILSTQRRLASITEMIHVASLLHDDVIDTSPLRRGLTSAPHEYSNKLSILAGDFLLGRASVALARLGSNEVTECMATVLANLVEGEVMQLRNTSNASSTTTPTDTNTSSPNAQAFEIYMRKTYLKTASLMAKSARSAVILGGATDDAEGERLKTIAYAYGRNLGIAFQLIDDTLDFLPASSSLGKPSAGSDLSLGLTTAPSLYAWQEDPSLGPLIGRKFREPGDVQRARDLVLNSNGIERTRELARKFAAEARRGIEVGLPASQARDALVELTNKVIDRVA